MKKYRYKLVIKLYTFLYNRAVNASVRYEDKLDYYESRLADLG